MDQATISATRSLEASILGAILIRPETMADLPRLEVDDFFDPRHRVVFAAMRTLEASTTPIDVVTVEAEITKRGRVEAVGGYAFLGELALHVPTVSNAIAYAKQVREAAMARRVLVALDDVIEKGRQQQLSGSEILSLALESLSGIDEDQPDTAVDIAVLVGRRMKQLDQIANERATGQRSMTGYPTGVAALDEKIGGWQSGIATIVAARPAMGKSSLGLATADECTRQGFGVHLFSLEDTEESYADRTLARTSGVPAEDFRNANLNRGQLSDIARAWAGLRGRRWMVDGRSGITADEIVRSVRRKRRANDTRVVIVDYVQLVKRAPRVSAHDALTEIITTLADAAKQDKLAYVVMSQLNREVEKRQDKRPQMADLRESGSLEERSKCIVGLYRGSVYGKPIKGVDFDPQWKQRTHCPSDEDFAREVQICVIKNSNGRTGTVWAEWHGPTTRLT